MRRGVDQVCLPERSWHGCLSELVIAPTGQHARRDGTGVVVAQGNGGGGGECTGDVGFTELITTPTSKLPVSGLEFGFGGNSLTAHE